MLFVALLASLVSAAVFGIDYGSEFIKISMALPGKSVHVVMNQQSKRLSPSFFAVWNASNPGRTNHPEKWALEELNELNWAFNDPARSHSLRFPKNAQKGFIPLLNNALGFTKREILSLSLRHLIKTIDTGKWTPETASIVFVVEPWLSRAERYAIIEAVSLANATLTSIIEAPTAVAYTYAFEKTALFNDKPRTVLFLDLGSAHTWAAIYKFTNFKDKIKVDSLSLGANYSLGGNTMDQMITDYLIGIINETVTPKVRQRIMEEAKKAKEILTLNKKVEIKIEDVTPDRDFFHTMTRETFNSLIQEYNASLCNLLGETLKKANLSMTDIDSIELLGGSTRVPFIQNVILQNSGMEKLNRTLNSDEAMALGAGYVGASQSSAFIVKEVQIDPFSSTNVSVVFPDHSVPLFNESSFLTDNRTISVFVNDTLQFNLTSDGVTIRTYEINVENATEVNLTFGFDVFTLPVLLNENVTGFTPMWTMSYEDMENSTSVINKMDHILMKRYKLHQIKNDLESFIYGLRSRLEYDDIFKRVTTDEEKEEIKSRLHALEEWFDNEEERRTAKVYKQKLQEIQNFLSKVNHRCEEYKERPRAVKAIQETLEKTLDALTNFIPSSMPWVTEDRLNHLWTIYNSTSAWIKEKLSLQSNISETEDPLFSSEEALRRSRSLELSLNMTKRIPKPSPTPTPTVLPDQNNTTDFETTHTSEEQNTTSEVGQEQSESKEDINNNGSEDMSKSSSEEL